MGTLINDTWTLALIIFVLFFGCAVIHSIKAEIKCQAKKREMDKIIQNRKMRSKK